MKNLFIFTLLLTLLTGSPTPNVESGESVTSVHEVGFADALDAKMPSDGNYMFSPLSIKLALAMAANGAEGETRDEILSACGIIDISAFNSDVKSAIERYSKSDILSLDISDSIWLNSDNTSGVFADKFKKTIAEYYDGEASTVGNADAVEKINNWVDEKTNGKITRIIDTPEFAAALVNAIYFKAAWQNEFYEGATKKDKFTSADGTLTEIDFMNQTDYFRYGESDGVKIIELPYSSYSEKFGEDGSYEGSESTGLNISMYVLMGDGNVENPKAVLDGANLESTYVALSVPKFETEFSIDLTGILKGLGIERAFSANDADFSAMIEGASAYIDKVLHKTYIKVDEKGTEAAAVTAAMAGTTSLSPEPIELKLNHPFSYIILDNDSGEVLFMGRYVTGE